MQKSYSITRKLLQVPSQVLIVTFLKLISLPFTSVKCLPESFQIKKTPHIIVANHRHMTDAFIMYGALPYRTILKLTPMTAMLADRFYDSPLRPVLWLMGCFPARNKKNNHKLYGVEGGISLLKNNFNLCIFPHGRTIKPHEEGKVYPGIIEIHKASPNTPMILCHIEYNPGWKVLVKRKKVALVYKLVESPKYDTPEAIMDDIYAL